MSQQHVKIQLNPLKAENAGEEHFKSADSGHCCEAGAPSCQTRFANGTKVVVRRAGNGDLILKVTPPGK